MDYRNLGRWGVKVSSVGLGSWLTYGGSVESDVARACIRRALEHGITFFDTANAYMRGASEEVVGAALADVRRDDYVLATKVYFPVSTPMASGDHTTLPTPRSRHTGRTRRSMRR